MTILVVDDEPAHVEAIRRSFQDAGVDVAIRTAGTLREYRELVAARPPDIAIVDLNLPDGQAIGILTAPPEHGPFPVVVMTSRGDEQTAVRAMKAGALDYVVKSQEAFSLMARTLGRALREWNLLQERKQARDAHERLEARFVQSQKMEAVGRLAGGVAHDFNNMLCVILGHVELALEKSDLSEPLRDSLQEIKTAGRRSADLVRQLLAFARRQPAAPEVIDLNVAVGSALTMLRRLIGEDIDLAWKPGDELCQVMLDPGQLDQMLANLVVNARDATPGAGRITIETGNVELDKEYCSHHDGLAPGRYVMVAVTDDGSGMDTETLAHIFEPFFTTKPQGQGTGLGLATVYGIVKQNGGFIGVESEPRKGTTFRIYLPPLAVGTVPTHALDTRVYPTRGNETLLLAEDEAAVLDLTRRMLEELGYTVLAAGTPAEALGLAREHPGKLHLLVTDVVMPGMSGRELWQRVQALQPDTKCLFMSGYTADVMARHGVLEEGIRFIQKPFSRQDLATGVRTALAP